MPPLLTLHPGPTGYTQMPPGGTDGVLLTDSTLGIDSPGLAHAKTLSGTVSGTIHSRRTRGSTVAVVQHVNLLNGLITADAVLSRANVDARRRSGLLTGRAEPVDLSIGGRRLPLSPPPNSTITIPGVVQVVVNEQNRGHHPCGSA